MTKRMLIDDTHPEETRVVVLNGNKIEDVELETSSRKQIKSNVYLAKVMRVEPSLQAAFVDYGGNRHGFLAFGEIHPDYYHVSEETLKEIEKEVDDVIESKKQSIKDREAEREKRKQAAEERRQSLAEEAKKAIEENAENSVDGSSDVAGEEASFEDDDKKPRLKKRIAKKLYKKVVKVEEPKPESEAEVTAETVVEPMPVAGTIVEVKEEPKAENLEEKTETVENNESSEFKVLSSDTGLEEPKIYDEHNGEVEDLGMDSEKLVTHEDAQEELGDDDDDDEEDLDFELQRKLLKVRKLFHRSNIQDVIKEGQVLLVQIVKEERGNKGAALTTYLSLAGRYCVLMPNRIKSGGVSRKITNMSDRKRLKSIVRELPLTSDMSMIVRTAGEEKTKADIVRDYNYLMRSWNQIRLDSLQKQAPCLIHEEGNLIKRALRDMYSRDISEIIVDGEKAYNMARDFTKILSPHNLKKLKGVKKNDIPLFQRFQIEAQLDKLHDPNVSLDSGGYLVINPTEALVAIDVNSGRATREKDLEETALKTNLEAADEIARQLRLRNLAGLIVIDFIDMDESKNNQLVEKRMKEAMKNDRSRIQISKMSCFGLMEISRQRMHSSFFESNYRTCPHCHGRGIVRTTEAGSMLIIRAIEEEGIKNRSSRLNIFVPSDTAIYLLNQKRQLMIELEKKYGLNVIISADETIKNVADYRIEKVKAQKSAKNEKPSLSSEEFFEEPVTEETTIDSTLEKENTAEVVEVKEKEKEKEKEPENNRRNDRRHGRDRGRNNRHNGGRRYGRDRDNRDNNRHDNKRDNRDGNGSSNVRENKPREKQEAVILYNSHGDTSPKEGSGSDEGKKPTWWKKLTGGKN